MTSLVDLCDCGAPVSLCGGPSKHPPTSPAGLDIVRTLKVEIEGPAPNRAIVNDVLFVPVAQMTTEDAMQTLRQGAVNAPVFYRELAAARAIMAERGCYSTAPCTGECTCRRMAVAVLAAVDAATRT